MPDAASSPVTFASNLRASRQWLHNASMGDRLSFILGTGFGSGLAGKAPGTWGSLAALVLVPLWMYLPALWSLLLLTVAGLAGIHFCARTAVLMRTHDDGRIVWDEWIGQSLALVPLMWTQQWSLLTVAAGFILFRLFDIVKPWPVGWLDRQLAGGSGIMADDVAAGLMAAGGLYGLCLLLASAGR